jgi:hypothetical protein
MKTFLVALFMVVATSYAFAQSVTIVMVTPQRPVSCLVEDAKLVNWVYQVKTVSEDADMAHIQFVTQYGHCSGGKVVAEKIDPKWAQAYAMQNSNVWPWQKEGVKTQLSVTSETEMIVSMDLNKRVLFKKKAENHLTFYFEPGIQVAQNYWNGRQYTTAFSRIYFPWNVDVYLDGEIDGNNSLRMMIR